MEQKLLHSPQMIQAMQVLQLTTPELIERIEAEIEENPFLEFADSERNEPSEQSDGNDSEEERFEEELSSLDRLLEAEGRTGISAIDKDEGWDSIQNLPAPEAHTQDSLLAELRVTEHPPHFLAAAEAILTDLDERGFLADGCEGVEQRHGIPLDDIRCTLSLLRQIAHPALGAETLQECYLLQLDSLSEMDALIRTLIEDHFEELLSNRLPHIAQEMGCSMS
ncbi:MAG: hypothetical protein MK213_05985, partial [Planctomycetes bacterium]|nr:hypothetical protein [Planctomycetota bacterium]